MYDPIKLKFDDNFEEIGFIAGFQGFSRNPQNRKSSAYFTIYDHKNLGYKAAVDYKITTFENYNYSHRTISPSIVKFSQNTFGINLKVINTSYNSENSFRASNSTRILTSLKNVFSTTNAVKNTQEPIDFQTNDDNNYWNLQKTDSKLYLCEMSLSSGGFKIEFNDKNCRLQLLIDDRELAVSNNIVVEYFSDLKLCFYG